MNILCRKRIRLIYWFLTEKINFEKGKVVSHYLKTVLAIVLFAKVQGVVMLENPRTRRVRGLSDFTSPMTFVKNTTVKTVLM